MSRAFINLAFKTCAYCKGTGHTKYNCQLARDKIIYIKQQIEVCKSDPTRALSRLNSLFNYIPLTEICLLMLNLWANRIKPVIQHLVNTGYIDQEEAKMRYKKNRIAILIWHYWDSEHPKPRKLNNIVAKISLKVDLSEVDCPICVECKPTREKVVTNCNHCICNTCMVNYLEHQTTKLNFPKPLCVLCRTVITSLTFNNIEYMTEISTKYL